MHELVKKLCSANAPSGCEDAVIHIITKRLDELNVPYVKYPSGNVIASLISGKSYAPRIMVQCHVDEVGFMVKGHRDGGYLSLSPLGISDVKYLVGKRVTLLADTPVSGSIGAVPIHLSKDKDLPSMDDLYADVGFTDSDIADLNVPLGTFGCFDTDLKYFGKDSSFISGKALSSRIPCAIMLEVIQRLKNVSLDVNLCFAFTVRGNLSLCGAAEAYKNVFPDVVISVSGISANDTPDITSPICRLGHGAAISKGETRYRFATSVPAQLCAVAESNGISTQLSRPMTDDEDRNFDVIRMKNAGARLATVMLPVRNIRSSCESVAKSDVNAVADLLCAAVPLLEV